MGNLISRIYSITHDKTQQEAIYDQTYARNNVSDTIKDSLNRIYSEYIKCMELTSLKTGLFQALRFSSEINALINEFKIWVVVKNDLEMAKKMLGVCWYLIFIATAMIGPFMPSIQEKIKNLVKQNQIIGNGSLQDEFQWDLWTGKITVVPKKIEIVNGKKTQINAGIMAIRITDDQIEKYKKIFG